jgi:hypothetical protein
MKTLIPMSLVFVAGLAACATTPVPADKLSRSQAAVRSAEEMNAQAEPAAAMHLRLAHEQIALAKQLLKDGDNERAASVLLRAEADADAARELARKHAARMEAQTAKQNIEQLKSSMEGPKS